MNLLLKAAITTAICFQAWASPALAQGYSQAILASYRVLPNVPYLKSGVWEGKLDIYSRIDSSAPQPTLVFIHGGGSLAGSKESALFSLLPYLEWGWNVVNVEHRLAELPWHQLHSKTAYARCDGSPITHVNTAWIPPSSLCQEPRQADGLPWRRVLVCGRTGGRRHAPVRKTPKCPRSSTGTVTGILQTSWKAPTPSLMPQSGFATYRIR